MKDTIFLLGRKPILCLLLFVLLGCASSPHSRFYLLSPLQNNSEVRLEPGVKCINIGIGPVKVPEYTNRPQIVTRNSQHELSRAQFDLWAEPLPDTVSRVIAENLTQLLCINRVDLFPWEGSIKPDYIVKAEIMEMSGDLDKKAYLHVQWTLWGAAERKELVRKRSNYIERVQDPTYHSLVQAYSIMVGQLSLEIAAAIEGL